MLRPESWMVMAAAGLGIVAAVVAFIRTPSARRLRVRAPSVEQRLAAAAPEARAVIIRADRRRALRRDLPWLLAMLPLAAIALWFEATRGDACAALLGIGRTRWAVWGLFTLPPLLVVPAGLMTVRHALCVLRGGYWPPLGTAVYTDTLAASGPRARLRAIVQLALLTVLLAVVAYGYAQALRLAIGGKLWERVGKAEAACVVSSPR